jgi:hypothetical protein
MLPALDNFWVQTQDGDNAKGPQDRSGGAYQKVRDPTGPKIGNAHLWKFRRLLQSTFLPCQSAVDNDKHQQHRHEEHNEAAAIA